MQPRISTACLLPKTVIRTAERSMPKVPPPVCSISAIDVITRPDRVVSVSLTQMSGWPASITTNSRPPALGTVTCVLISNPRSVGRSVQVAECTPASLAENGRWASAAAIAGVGREAVLSRTTSICRRCGTQTSLHTQISSIAFSFTGLPFSRGATVMGKISSFL